MKKILKFILYAFGVLLSMIIIIVIVSVYGAYTQPSKEERAKIESDRVNNERLDKLRDQCRAMVRGVVKNPSTLDMHVMGGGRNILSDGSAYIAIEFSAKNSFGLELTNRIECFEGKDGDFSYRVREQ